MKELMRSSLRTHLVKFPKKEEPDFLHVLHVEGFLNKALKTNGPDALQRPARDV
jgi:hypothetical protein